MFVAAVTIGDDYLLSNLLARQSVGVIEGAYRRLDDRFELGKFRRGPLLAEAAFCNINTVIKVSV